MKRIISIALVALMLVALALPVFADALPDDAIDDSLTDKVTVTVTPKDDTVYYKVDIAWGDLDFAYTGAEWDAEAGCYKNGTWDKTSSSVTVTNSSNKGISVTADLSSPGAINGITAKLDNEDSLNFTLDSATDADGTSERIISVSISGNPTADSFTVSTISITLSTSN